MNRRSHLIAAALGPAVLLWWTSCAVKKPSSSTPPVVTPPPVPTCTEAAPCALQPGVAMQGTIATKGLVNHYSIVVPADQAGKRPIVQILLDRTSLVSAVQPVFTLTSSDGMTVLGTRGPAPSTGAVHLAANFLVPGPDNYQLVVHDAEGTAFDARNPYSVTANVLDDPDSGEPDDTVPTARPVVLGTPLQGNIAFAGDHDLVTFKMTGNGGLMHFVLDEAAAAGPLQLRMRVYLLSTTTPDDLITAISVGDYSALQPGDALHVDVIRNLQPGTYVAELTDVNELNADATPAAQWTLTLSTAVDADPQDQHGMHNDQFGTAATIAPTGTTTLSGLINFDGNHDWFHVALPASTTANIVQIGLDPGLANADVQLLWAVGIKMATPSGACDATCGPRLFCTSGLCGYTMHALREYAAGDETPQSVRIRQQGTAEDIYILLMDQGDDNRTDNPYTLTVTVMPDPDPNEPTTTNDTIATATSLPYSIDTDGGVSYSGSGMISWWDYIDGLGTFEEREDLDWFHLPLPPKSPTPCIPYVVDAGSSDGGSPDANIPFPDSGYTGILEDGGCDPASLPDGGQCAPVLCPVYPDGGPVLDDRLAYGLTMHWHGPQDGAYKLGLQGVGLVQGTQNDACLFSFDQAYAHDEDGGYVFGNVATDPCFCLPAAQAAGDEMWVRIEGPHRPIPPAANVYSDEPYGWELDMTPGTLTTTCNGKCPALTSASMCP